MSHSTRIVQVSKPASGLLAVTIRCCDDPTTDSVLTIHQLHRSDEDIQKDIDAHKARVEELHAHDGRADDLMKTLGATIGDCGCPK
jgi:hypothetical protein